jgi:hypothetical protein
MAEILEQEVKVYQFMQGYGEMLLADIPDDGAFKLICDGGVHPAWIIGHLGFVANRVLAMCGGEAKIDTEGWKPLFGGGSTPTSDPGAYPKWNELIDIWKQGHADVVALVPAMTDESLSQPNPNDRMREALPTVGDFLSFVLTGHEAMHLGQLSTWRRVQGRPPLF